MLSWEQIQANAIAFSKKYSEAYNEEAQAQAFIIDFFNIFGLDPLSCGAFEYKLPLSHNKTGYIDYLWKNHIAVEMKSKGHNLKIAYEQLKNYMAHLPQDEMPDLLMVCDFENIKLVKRSMNEEFNFKTKDLRKNIKKFADLIGSKLDFDRDYQIEINVKGAEKMALLHDLLKIHGYDGHDLKVYLVRILFCLFAADTGIFPPDSLYHYIKKSMKSGSDLSEHISRLFEILNMPPVVREKRTLLSNELKQFCYVNGKLFEKILPSAEFDREMRGTLLDCLKFDWHKISPAVFGAMFQGVMDKNERREMGAHYTSEENIMKLIKPLFLDDLYRQFEEAKATPIALNNFHEKLANLKFLDPACGCGNFLIITYRELRMLELEVLKYKYPKINRTIDITPVLKVTVEQFYGIEIEDFPCQIAQVGMWLIDHQMNMLVSDHFGIYHARLPLTQSATIVHGNALQLDWENVVNREELDYILGNPPFLGGMTMSREQKKDMVDVFGEIKCVGEMDYVTAWYKKAIDYMKTTYIKSAFVSTNSISQGQQAITFWQPIIKEGVHINFAYQTFKWSNEAKGKAAVHCVIVGFSFVDLADKQIFSGDSIITAKNINSYLIDSPNVFIEFSSKPLCEVPPMHFGNMPRDGGGFVLTDAEKDDLITAEPLAEKWIRSYIGSQEFINNESRWCLWLVNANPAELKKCPIVMQRIESVKQFRLNSVAKETRKFAETPTLFAQITQPENVDYIIIPRVSSEKRMYVPIGFMKSSTIASDAVQIIPNATLYHFGILTSIVHMAWVRVVCGRLKSDYRYSKDIVYNNFIWPEIGLDSQSAISGLAQAVINVRSLYPESSLADLYDPLTMPPELRQAHKELDRAVMKLYGLGKEVVEREIVVELMKRYEKIKYFRT